jgi:hypothetical protein
MHRLYASTSLLLIGLFIASTHCNNCTRFMQLFKCALRKRYSPERWDISRGIHRFIEKFIGPVQHRLSPLTLGPSLCCIQPVKYKFGCLLLSCEMLWSTAPITAIQYSYICKQSIFSNLGMQAHVYNNQLLRLDPHSEARDHACTIFQSPYAIQS